MRVGLLQTRWLQGDHLGRLLSACGAAHSTADGRTLGLSVRVKLMVVVFSEVGQGGEYQGSLPRTVFCHVDQSGGEMSAQIRRADWGVGGSKSRSLTSDRLLAPG